MNTRWRRIVKLVEPRAKRTILVLSNASYVLDTSDLYYAVLKTYSDNQIKSLQAFCTWYAFYKYYDGVECDEGAVAQVKELMSFKEMLETLVNKEDKQEKEWLTHKYALYLATHIQGWWD